MGRRVYHNRFAGFRTCNTQQDIVDFLTANPGYYSETELLWRCFGYHRNFTYESNKKYADLLRRAWAKGLVTRRFKSGSTSRYEWYLPEAVTTSVPEEKNFPELLENRNNGQTFTLTNSNNINTQKTHTMENTSITTATVQSCISSIFSKEDVLNLLEQQRVEILASIPEPKPTTELSRDIIRRVADALLACFESDIKSGLANVDFDDIVNDCDIEVDYDKRIRLSIDSRSAVDAVNEAIGYELPDAEGVADLIEQEIDKAKHSVSEQ